MQVLRWAAQREFAAIILGLQVIRVTAYLNVLYQYINISIIYTVKSLVMELHVVTKGHVTMIGVSSEAAR